MSDAFVSKNFPFNDEGELCPVLNDGQFLVDVYSVSGNRPSIKAFCKKIKWPDKPKVGISVGEEQLKVLLPSLFNSPIARVKLDKAGEKSGKMAAPPLHQAMWGWLLETSPELGEKVKDNCHERGEGLHFLSADGLETLCKETKEEESETLARIVLAFVMLQPKDAEELVLAFLKYFPAMTEPIGQKTS